nr:Alpha amylase, catalytic region [uncultured bacterium]
MLEANQPFIIDSIEPSVDGGRYPIKREVGDTLKVRATVFRDGHNKTRVFLKFREKHNAIHWIYAPMQSVNEGLSLWTGQFKLERNTLYEYTIEAYTDIFQTWLEGTKKKVTAGEDVRSDLVEGRVMLERILAGNTPKGEKAYLEFVLSRIDQAASDQERLALYGDQELTKLMERSGPRDDLTTREPYLEVVADRVRARFAAWYEFFPRSQGSDPNRSATFRECILRLPEIKKMGFDVVYLPPIHPIGITGRKGKNNSLQPLPEEPGCPYAIGNAAGGHMAVDPALGTMEDFIEFEKTCRDMGMEVALDFAINCSPDHPYVKEHPEWFFKRPDGSIKYAENPPKKYEDIYPLNFDAPEPHRRAIWEEMRRVFLFWIERGVRIFRVDNPHTKPVPFWHWLINSLQKDHPDVIFLAEAFTKPPMMRTLAKVGFTQSYTYFTWRNFKDEITAYMTELTQSEHSEYMRGNLFANTPDILPRILQEGGRPAFMMRYVLAATLSSVYGIYSGYELCEREAVPGKEEYLNSEKYQFKVWDWNRPGNIKAYIETVNNIRRVNAALHGYRNLRFFRSDNPNILFYGKVTPDKRNVILVVVNVDPFNAHEGAIYIPLEEIGIRQGDHFELQELIAGGKYLLQDRHFHVKLEPSQPAWIFRVDKWEQKEQDFDQFNM